MKAFLIEQEESSMKTVIVILEKKGIRLRNDNLLYTLLFFLYGT